MRQLDKMEFKLPERAENSHKGTFGKVLNIAGSKYMPGAAYLSSVAALKIGCGYCFLATEESVIKSVSAQTQNIVFVPLKDIKKQLKTSDVLAIGCGLSTSFTAGSIFETAVDNVLDIPTVIDADGLNILAGEKNINLPDKLIITPHPSEAARLLKTTTENVLSDMEKSAKALTGKYNCVTVLKSHKTVVCSKDFEIYVNQTGNSALAKAGSGDVLTGMIAGLAAQNVDIFTAAKLGVYLHGLCGEIASEKLTEYCVMADDLIGAIPEAVIRSNQ